MLKKMLGTFTAVVTALAVVGVAWASSDDDSSTSVTAAGSTSATVEASAATDATVDTTGATIGGSVSTGATVETSSSTGATVGSSTPTTIDDNSTSTSVDSSTSTSVDDSNLLGGILDGVSTHEVPGVGTVTIAVTAGRLSLVSTSLSLQITEQRLEPDRIELRMESGDSKARFEARIEGDRLEVKVDVD